jgi:peptidoglycan hydrolase-like protein with peptidoglycan-binding domain
MRLNQVLHTNLRVNGIITTEMNQALRRAQAQLGLPQTGYPDAQTLQKLGLGTGVGGAKTSQTRTAPITSSSKTSPVTEVTKVISKTFGGPPGALATGPDEGMRKAQHMLNLYFGGSLLAENGIAGPETVEKIGAFQDALGLPRTGTVNQKTYDILESAVRQSGAPAAQVSAQMTSRLKEAIMRLNGLLHTSIPVTGTTSPELSQAIVRFQELASLPQTGMLDPATLDKLREKTSHGVQEDVSGYFVGVDAGDWKSETQGLPQFSQDVLSKIIATETNQRTLKSVGKVLGDAGYPKAAAAVLAKAGGAAATTGYFPDPHYGVYPFAHGPWWAYPQASWGW